MKLRNNESGFILVQVLVGIVVTGIVAAAFMSMSNYSLQATKQWKDSDRALLVAKSALDKTKFDMYQQFLIYCNEKEDGKEFSKVSWYDQVTDQSIGVDTVYMLPKEATFTNELGIVPRWAENSKYTVNASVKPKGYSDRYLKLQVVATVGDSVRTVEEFMVCGMNSEVFTYAYFINNFGWLHNGNLEIWGDVRSNGNLSLKANPYINGDVYASYNPDLGAPGDILGEIMGDWKFYDSSLYAGKATDSARPMDTADNPFLNGYTGEPVEFESTDPIEMPYLGDLSDYKELAQKQNGTLSGVDQDGNPVVLTNGVYSGIGPDGIADSPDDGCLVLDGRVTPIKIDGPVVVEKDLIILGKVEGKGTIFTGRNIHIVGDIEAVNPLTFDKTGTLSEDEQMKIADNADQLVLAAKGNIIVGNYTSNFWQNKVPEYIQPEFVFGYETDPSDSSIGYDSDGNSGNGYFFDGNYTALDGGEKVSTEPVFVALDGSVSGSRGSNVIFGNGTTFTESNLTAGSKVQIGTETFIVKSVDSDTRITLSEPISKNLRSATVSTEDPTAGIPRKYYEASISDELYNKLCMDMDTGNGNEIEHLDTVLYTNHLVAGDVGHLQLTGSIVARNDALLFTGQLDVTWDVRLANSMEQMLGMEEGQFLPQAPMPPQTVMVREL